MTAASLRLRAALAACVLSALLAAGCTLLQPTPDPSRFFVLSPLASAGAAVEGLSLGVGPVSLPGYLEVAEVQVREGASELRRSPIDRWAEPLGDAITRVLAQNLSTELGTREVVLFPWYAHQAPTYQVKVWVRRFELDPDGSAVLEARYEVGASDAMGDGVIRDVALRRAAADGDVAASVTALSETLAELARQIATDVRSFAGS